jgi:serine/threonine-protein kinase
MDDPLIAKAASTSSPLFSVEHWQRIRPKLEQLLDASELQRATILTELESSAPELAKDLRALLPAELSLRADSCDQLADAVRNLTKTNVPARIGPFRLHHCIGVGGIGTVYLAEREHADFTQLVALKLLDGGSTRLAQLALRERRILAALKHPNITAFVDAGMEHDRAWLAMEFVEGQALLDHCHDRQLTARQRVQLFDQICAAVAHAHAQLVVHRDLKPSNVLVDRQGNAKLLDFGIALVLDDGDEGTPATRVFTPEYAAPEQLRGERVGTACDVYSLGLLLFEMLAGHRLDAEARSRRTGAWRVAELLRFALAMPTPASTATRAERGLDAKLLTPLLRGDLGQIIAHCLHAEPTERYASVALLREDLARWLDDRRLSISHRSRWQSFRRFVRRHRLAVSASCLSLALITALTITALWQAHGKALEAERAKSALRQSEATRDFLNSAFLSADPFHGKGSDTTIGEVLKQASARIDTELAQQPEIAASLLYQIGNVYVSLGDDDASRENLRRALRFNARSEAPSTLIEGSTRARLAMFDFNPAQVQSTLDELASAIMLLRSAGPEAAAELARALDIQSNILHSAGRQAASIAAAQESIALLKNLAGEQAHVQYLDAMQSLADRLAAMEQYQQALPIIEAMLADPAFPNFDQDEEQRMLIAFARATHARVLTGLNRFAEASLAFDEAISKATQVLGWEHGNTRYFRFLQLQLWMKKGELARARAAVDALTQVPPTGGAHPVTQLAILTTSARIRWLERRADALPAVLAAQAQTCGESGHAALCGHSKLLLVELSLYDQSSDPVRINAQLQACATDAGVQANPAMLRRSKLLQARWARIAKSFAEASALLQSVRMEKLSPEESTALDIEAGYLALAQGQFGLGIETLTRARSELLMVLSEPTPQVLEIDAAIAGTK